MYCKYAVDCSECNMTFCPYDDEDWEEEGEDEDETDERSA